MDESGENQPSGGGCGSLCMTGYHGDCVYNLWLHSNAFN